MRRETEKILKSEKNEIKNNLKKYGTIIRLTSVIMVLKGTPFKLRAYHLCLSCNLYLLFPCLLYRFYHVFTL